MGIKRVSLIFAITMTLALSGSCGNRYDSHRKFDNILRGDRSIRLKKIVFQQNNHFGGKSIDDVSLLKTFQQSLTNSKEVDIDETLADGFEFKARFSINMFQNVDAQIVYVPSKKTFHYVS